MRRYAVMLKRRQRNTITLRQLFNEWLPIHSQSISDSAVKSYRIAFKHTIHDTRHTFASLLDAVAPPNALRSLLGHKQGDITTRVYAHKTIRELRKTIELLK